MPDTFLGKLIAAGTIAQASGCVPLGIGVIVVILICIFVALVGRAVFGLI